MNVISLHYPDNINKEDYPELSIALGFFDGVHLGHRKVILEAKRIAEEKGLKSAVMTFDPHPSAVLGKQNGTISYITPIAEKQAQMEKLGIDYLFIVEFSKAFANLSPEDFVRQYLIGLNVKHVTAGFDYTYGSMGKGTMDTLPLHGNDQFDVTVVPKLESEQEKVSSTRIRKMISEGQTEKIPALLGRFFTTSGEVIHGDKRGRTIGFPTANIDVSADYLLPPTGVYTVKIKVKSIWHEGVCNIGYKPTFHTAMPKPSVEVHIFDFDEDIYGEHVTVEWHTRLRGEQKFAGIDGLIEQISKDKQAAADYFGERATRL